MADVFVVHALQGFAQMRGAPGMAEELLCRLHFLHGVPTLRTQSPCDTLRMVRRQGLPALNRTLADTSTPAQGYSERVCTLLAEKNVEGAVKASQGFVGAEWGFPDVAVAEWRFRDTP